MRKAIYYGIAKVKKEWTKIEYVASNGNGEMIGILRATCNVRKHICFIDSIDVINEYRRLYYATNLLYKLIINMCATARWIPGNTIEIRTNNIYINQDRDLPWYKNLFIQFGFEVFNASSRVIYFSLNINRDILPSKPIRLFHNDISLNIGIIESETKLFGVIGDSIILDAEQYYFTHLISANKSVCKYLSDFTFYNNYADEPSVIEAFEKMVKRAELMLDDTKFDYIVISVGNTKKIRSNIKYSEILKPLGYKYNIKYRGFVKEIKK